MSDGAGLGNLLLLLLPLILLAWVFTSQRKRAKVMGEFQAGLTAGSQVVTTSGIYGRITALDDTTATLEVSPGVSLRIDRRAIGMPAPGATGTPDGAAR